MKTHLLTGFIIFVLGNAAFAQITITQADMPQPGDTIRLSTSSDTTGLPAPSFTGANVTWNYASLVPQTQKIDTFLSVSSTPLLYQLYFNDAILYPNYKSTVAQASPSINLSLVQLTDIINYYKDENNNYESVGYGTTISSIPTSVKDDTIDVVYNFPMNYGNADSCNSSSHIGIASLGYYGTHQKRINHVDGYGTLITPYGTFQVLRVTTILYSSDSIYVDTFHFGFKSPQTEQIQYKWLGNGIPVPLLQINETVVANRATYVNTVYPDNKHNFAGIPAIQSTLSNVELYPNPAGETSSLHYFLSENSEISIAVFSADGRCVQKSFDGLQTAGSHQLAINTSQLSPGIYLITINGKSGQVVKRMAVIH
jgi:hypothetical protein